MGSSKTLTRILSKVATKKSSSPLLTAVLVTLLSAIISPLVLANAHEDSYSFPPNFSPNDSGLNQVPICQDPVALEAVPDPDFNRESWLQSVRQDAFLIESEEELDQLLGLLLSQFTDSFIAYIQQPSDLDEDELVNAISLVNAHQEPLSRPVLMPGKLFSDGSVILVIDFRTMTPGRIAEFNELYDNPPRLRGQELGEKVRIIALTSETMMGSSDSATMDKPGSDFWRRITSPENHWQIDRLYEAFGMDKLPLSKLLRKWVSSDSTALYSTSYMGQRDTIEIDFPYFSDWRYALQGGLGLDESADISHIKGPITTGDKNTLYVLKLAPWQDTRFKVRLANIITNRGFEQYNQCYGSNEYRFLAVDSEPLNPGRLSQVMVPTSSNTPASKLYPINDKNIDTFLNSVSLDPEGSLAKGNLFEAILRLYEGVLAGT